jgi:hypothetical protein
MEEVLVKIWDDRIKFDTGERVEAAERLEFEHRGDEVHQRKSRGGRKVNYTYTPELERDFQNHLLEKGASFMLAQVS